MGQRGGWAPSPVTRVLVRATWRRDMGGEERPCGHRAGTRELRPPAKEHPGPPATGEAGGPAARAARGRRSRRHRGCRPRPLRRREDEFLLLSAPPVCGPSLGGHRKQGRLRKLKGVSGQLHSHRGRESGPLPGGRAPRGHRPTEASQAAPCQSAYALGRGLRGLCGLACHGHSHPPLSREGPGLRAKERETERASR